MGETCTTCASNAYHYQSESRLRPSHQRHKVSRLTIFLRLLRALTLSERFGNAGFGQHVGDLKEA